MTTTQNDNFLSFFVHGPNGSNCKVEFQFVFRFFGWRLCPIKISEYFAFKKDSCSVETLYVRLFAPNFSPFKNETNWTVCQLEKE